MRPSPSPAMEALLSKMGIQFAWGEVMVVRFSRGFELRHSEDENIRAESLRPTALADLRTIASHTMSGMFRPLKSAPTLQRGWRAMVADEVELEAALARLYPGSVADWFAASSALPPVTHYREFTDRQTGMYRITRILSDAQASGVIRAACHETVCLKRRRWSIEGLLPDNEGEKSSIPCLEPCAILLEFARKAARIEQEDKQAVQLSASEIETMCAALKEVAKNQKLWDREGDASAALNPRRVRFLLEKTRPLIGKPKGTKE